MQSRRLRIDANNEVQVYILMSAVTDETVRQLTDAGATIEIRDRRAAPRAGARAGVAPRPPSRNSTSSMRSGCRPTRGRASARSRREGDAILYADAVRGQFGLDGTGVRVGVVSDGMKGVFATGCTTACGGVDGGPIATGDLPAATGVRNAAGVLT